MLSVSTNQFYKIDSDRGIISIYRQHNLIRMITEIPYTIALLYPCINALWWREKIRREVEAKIEHNPQEVRGIEVFTNSTDYNPPTFVNVGQIMVPIGGGMTTNSTFVTSNYVTSDNKTSYGNFRAVPKTDSIGSGYINNTRHFNKVCDYYNLNSDSIPANFPLPIYKYHYKNGIYTYKGGNIGFISSNKDKLLQEVLWVKRMPFTVTIPAIAATCIVLGWFRYYVLDSDRRYGRYQAYYPPYHYKRIARYMKGVYSHY